MQSISEFHEDPLIRIPPPDRKALAHIPGSFGLPLVGCSLDWVRDMFAMTDRYLKRYGPVSKASVFGVDVVFAVGKENMQALYLNSEEIVSARLTPASPLSPFYPGALLFTDGADHRGKRRFMQHAFKSDAMRAYVSRIDEIAAKHASSLPTDKAEPMFPRMKRLMTEVSATIFFGLEDGDPMAETLMNDFVVMNRGMVSLIKTELPIPGLNHPKAMRASRRIEDYIRSVIPERREGEGTDVLSHLCRAQDEEGNWMPDEEVVRLAKFLFFAAHDTTSSTLTNMLLFTGRDPRWQQAMREELENVVGDQPFSYDHLEQLSTMQNVLHETLRFYPAVVASPRVALEGCRLSDIDIPAGTVVMLFAHQTYKLPEFWTEPETFDPARFTPGREEHKAHPFLFTPFGGGAHKCIGMHFAAMVTKIFYNRMLRDYSYELPADYSPKMSMLPLPKPANDLPMRFDRR